MKKCFVCKVSHENSPYTPFLGKTAYICSQECYGSFCKVYAKAKLDVNYIEMRDLLEAYTKKREEEQKK